MAYAYYNKIKAKLSSMYKPDESNKNPDDVVNIYKEANGESTIQNSFIIKIPKGVSIEFVKVISSNAPSE